MTTKTIFLATHCTRPDRDLMRSGFLDILRSQGLRIVLLSPAWGNGDYLYQEFAAEDVILERFHELVAQERGGITGTKKNYPLSAMEVLYQEVQDGLFEGISSTLTVKDRHLTFMQKSTHRRARLVRRAAFSLGSWFGVMDRFAPRAWGMRSLLRRLNVLLFPAKHYAGLFEKYKPSLVWTTYSPWETPVLPILRMAQRRRVPSIASLRSWDNMTTKGEIPVKIDKLIVWNEIMRKEAVELHGYRPEDVYISGPPVFDIHFQRRDKPSSKEEFLRRIGASPDKRLLTLTMISENWTPHEADVIDMIAKHIVGNRFVHPCQLLVRPRGGPEHARKYQKFEDYGNVIVDSTLKFDFGDRDLGDVFHLADSLLHSDVVINIASTITLEASIFDTPVVNIAFDGYAKRPYWDSVARFYEWDHYRNIVSTGGVRIARSEGELLEHINTYLENPELDREGRKRIVEEQCYYQDGRSRERVAECILDFLDSLRGAWR